MREEPRNVCLALCGRLDQVMTSDQGNNSTRRRRATCLCNPRWQFHMNAFFSQACGSREFSSLACIYYRSNSISVCFLNTRMPWWLNVHSVRTPPCPISISIHLIQGIVVPSLQIIFDIPGLEGVLRVPSTTQLVIRVTVL